MLHSGQKCDHFCSEWSIVGYWTGAFWDFWNWSIVLHSVNHCFIRLSDKMFPIFKWTLITGTAAFKVTMSPLWWRHQMETFARYWPFVKGIHRSPANSPHKGQWREALMFSLICARTNGLANHQDAGDLRRHRAHYDVTVTNTWLSSSKHTPLLQLPVKVFVGPISQRVYELVTLAWKSLQHTYCSETKNNISARFGVTCDTTMTS